MANEWVFESKYLLVRASPELRERFREAAKTELRDRSEEPTPEKVEELAANGWYQRAKELCERGDAMMEEGVPREEVMRLLKVTED
jgi:hypothetical protein